MEEVTLLPGVLWTDPDPDSDLSLLVNSADENGLSVTVNYGGLPDTDACDINGDGTTNVLDAQTAITQALGLAPCINGDIDLDGSCSVIDVQRVINAALGSACVQG
jgi:hypothetical protein